MIERYIYIYIYIYAACAATRLEIYDIIIIVF